MDTRQEFNWLHPNGPLATLRVWMVRIGGVVFLPMTVFAFLADPIMALASSLLFWPPIVLLYCAAWFVDLILAWTHPREPGVDGV